MTFKLDFRNTCAQNNNFLEMISMDKIHTVEVYSKDIILIARLSNDCYI